jgi:hypothetical protein
LNFISFIYYQICVLGIFQIVIVLNFIFHLHPLSTQFQSLMQRNTNRDAGTSRGKLRWTVSFFAHRSQNKIIDCS